MSTRAATRQQELEEQLAKLIGMMGQQQERQEHAAARAAGGEAHRHDGATAGAKGAARE